MGKNNYNFEKGTKVCVKHVDESFVIGTVRAIKSKGNKTTISLDDCEKHKKIDKEFRISKLASCGFTLLDSDTVSLYEKPEATDSSKEEVLVVDKDITKQEEKKPEEKPTEKTPKNPSPSKKGTKVLTPMYIPTSNDVVAEPVGTEAILAQVMMQKYYNNPELKKQCPELYSEMSRSIDFVVFIALVKTGQDFIKSGSKLGLKLTVPVEQVLPLQGMATMLGVELLPNCLQLKSDSSQMEIDFTKVKAPEELTEEGTVIEEEKAPEVELDPTKIETKDQLKDALAIMLNGPETNKSVIGAILTTLKWYDSYLFNDFHSAEEKLAADKLTIADKMNKILEVVKPNGLFSGIGSAAYQKAKQTKTLVGSFCVIKKHVMIQNGELTDREIASLLKCFVEHVAIKLNCDRDPKDKIKIEDDPVVKLLSSNGVDDLETILKKDYEHRNAIEGIIRSTLHQPGKTISRNEIITDIVNVYNLFRNETDQLDPSVFYEAPAPAPAPTETSKEEVKKDESKEQPKEEKEIDTSKDGKKDSNKNKSQKKKLKDFLTNYFTFYMVKNKTLLISFFCLSLLLGIGIKDNIGVGELNASPAPLYLTMQQRDCDTKFNDEISITYDLNTTKTTILGNSNCKVNFTTVGELKPTILTKIERDTIIKGYPRVNLAKVKPLSLPKLNITH